MLFYAALHVLEAAFDAEGVHNETHGSRELYIKQRHKVAWAPYHRLQTESMKARYLQGGAFALSARSVEAELRRVKFAAVRAYCRQLLGSARAQG